MKRTRRNPGQIRRTWARFRRGPLALGALVMLVIISLSGIFYSVLAPYPPDELLTGPPFAGPSWQHLVGTDDLGRDVFSRLLQGAGVSMRFSLIVVSIALLVAVPLGLFSGYLGGRFDGVLMRVMDGIMSFPGLVLVIAIVAVLGPNMRNAMIAITIGIIPGFTRLVRGQTLTVREETFIEASHAIGTSRRRVIWRHVLPNILGPLTVQVSIVLGAVLLVEAALSFLGLGVQPPTASWGVMLRRSYGFILGHPWGVIPAGAAIAITVFCFNAVGDGLRAALGGAKTRGPGRLGLTTVKRPATPALQADASGDLLVVDGLCLDFAVPGGSVRVVDGVSFSVAPGETLGIVGESGSGKTVTSLSIMRLLQSPPATITGGTVRFDGRDLLSLPFKEMARVRGNDLAMVFQDPMSSLNPAMTIVDQVAQAVLWHEDISRKGAAARALEMLNHVGIPERRANSYPHEFSGGMRQRAMIAMALVCRPKLLIADEPTTALDVTIQAQVLELMHRLRDELDMAILFVTHDLGVVADICDRVAVMYAGQVVEMATTKELFRSPKHPYTQGLLQAMPQRAEPRTPLYVIPGQVPSFDDLGAGCRFYGRCAYATDACTEVAVPLLGTNGHHVRCIRSDELTLTTR
jgi:peptide/nickel transport system permease protein